MIALLNRLEKLLALGGMKKDIACIVLAGLGVGLSIADVSLGGVDAAWAPIVLCGVPIVCEAIIGLIRDHDITADVLVALALVASLVTGEIFAAGEVAFIMQLGALLEELTVARARAGIERLVALTPTTARIMRRAGDAASATSTGSSEHSRSALGDADAANDERIVPAEEVAAGDILRVLPGETVPVDGIIIEGTTSINQAVMTGESLPVDCTPGDSVMSGTVNQYGTFLMRAERACADSSVQRMIRLVQSADAGRAKIVRLADRWAVWIVVTALVVSVLTYLVTGDSLRAVTVLVVFCPCALVLATPTAIMAAIGNATHHGFLVREGDALERLATVRKIAFDKTGTLTYGRLAVTDVHASGGLTANELLALTASAEQYSEHPLGQSIVRAYHEKCRSAEQKQLAAAIRHDAENTASAPANAAPSTGELAPAENFAMTPGAGISARVAGREVLAGTTAHLAAHGVTVTDGLAAAARLAEDAGSTVIYVAVDGELAGFIALADTIREDAPRMIARLERLGITPVLLTGDRERTARAIGAAVGIREIHAACLPETKLEHIRRYESAETPAAMIGDGINDAPALRLARVGIAMGGVGSDIAMDAADIVLVDDEIAALPHLLALARRMMRTIKLNLTFSMTLNFIAIALAVLGILNPVTGALVHNAGSVLVIVNSALLLKWKMRYN